MEWLETAIAFLREYWLFLSIVAVVLTAIIVLLVVLNAKSRVHEEEPKVETTPAEPIPPVIEVVEAEVMNPDPVFAEPVLDPEVPVLPSPAEVTGEPLTSPEPPADSVPVPVSEIPQDLPSPDEVLSQEEPSPEPQPKTPPKPLGKYHVMYRSEDNRWYVKREGSSSILRVLDTQREAVSWAIIKALPKDIGIVVHDKDGKIKKAQPL